MNVVAEPTTAVVEILKDPSVTVPSGIVTTVTGIAGPNATPEKLKPFAGGVEKVILEPATE